MRPVPRVPVEVLLDHELSAPGHQDAVDVGSIDRVHRRRDDHPDHVDEGFDGHSHLAGMRDLPAIAGLRQPVHVRIFAWRPGMEASPAIIPRAGEVVCASIEGEVDREPVEPGIVPSLEPNAALAVEKTHRVS